MPYGDACQRVLKERSANPYSGLSPDDLARTLFNIEGLTGKQIEYLRDLDSIEVDPEMPPKDKDDYRLSRLAEIRGVKRGSVRTILNHAIERLFFGEEGVPYDQVLQRAREWGQI